jgi:transcriptional regulator with XRE-family HTH domain
MEADIERSHYSRLERGLAQPTLFAVLKIARTLGVSAASLIDGGASTSASEGGITSIGRGVRGCCVAEAHAADDVAAPNKLT